MGSAGWRTHSSESQTVRRESTSSELFGKCECSNPGCGLNTAALRRRLLPCLPEDPEAIFRTHRRRQIIG